MKLRHLLENTIEISVENIAADELSYRNSLN